MKKTGMLAAALVLWAGTAQARTILDVDVAETRSVNGKELTLNGAGVRSATVMRVKLYVASFYTPEKFDSADKAMSARPLRFEFAFVRGFKQEKTQEAWRWQFEQSNTHVYDGLKKDVETFTSSFGAIKKFGVEAVEIEGDETRVYDDGKLKGTITGADFQKAFLSLWFGSKPVMPELKAALLGKKN